MENKLWFGPLNKENFEEMQYVIVEANRNSFPFLTNNLQTI